MTKNHVSNILEKNIIAADGIAVIDTNKKIIVFNDQRSALRDTPKKTFFFRNTRFSFYPARRRKIISEKPSAPNRAA